MVNYKQVLAIFLLIGLNNLNGESQIIPDFTVSNGVIHCREGIPQTPRWFADSRLAFAMEETGIPEVAYYAEGGGTIFLRHLWDGFRYYLVKDGLNYKPVYQNSRIWPFGIESEWEFQGFRFIHKVLAVEERMVFEITSPYDMPDGFQFKFDFNVDFALTHSDARDFRYPRKPGRQWKPWTFSKTENTLTGGYYQATSKTSVTAEDYTVCCVIGADFPLDYSIDVKGHVPVLTSPVLHAGKSYRVVIGFGTDGQTARKRNAHFIRRAQESIEGQYDRYRRLVDTLPQLHSPYPELNAYFSLLPLYHESLKVTDVPGAIRAKTWRYWVWGWDGMTHNSATAYWGDTQHIKAMLQFYRETADPQEGIAHSYGKDMKVGEYSQVPAQCMYLVLLQLYYDHTHDIALVKENFAFAKNIYQMAVAKEVRQTGLTQGKSLFPDYRDLVGETGNDISALNNSIFYCASRSMNRLAAILGDEEIERLSLRFSNKLEAHFPKHFFNCEKKYIASSLDASTLKQRDVYQSCSLRWENNYYYELIKPVIADCLDFVATHMVCTPGIREIPKWCSAYGADTNQLQAWWPVADESFVRMINLGNRRDLIDRWIGWLCYWHGLLTCPEAVSCHIETNRPETDRWSALKGTWQAFTMRTWYQAIVHGVVGVDADAGGITFYPYSGEEMTLRGLHYLGKTFDIHMKESGPFIEYVEVAGKRLIGTHKLPLECYQHQEHVTITVKRVASPPGPVIIKGGMGILISQYRYSPEKICAKLKGAGCSRLDVWALSEPIITIDGEDIEVEYDEKTNLASIQIDMRTNKVYDLQIGVATNVHP